MVRGLQFDEIGYWSEIKLDIVKKYAAAYTRILANQGRFEFVYIDGFAGPGVHLARDTGEFVSGSPLNALLIDPPFHEFFLVDLSGDKVDQLCRLPAVKERAEVHVFRGDCNEVLLREVFPKVRYDQFRRGLCLLDPYGLHLSWDVLVAAGQSRSIEIFLNFPIMDMNRNTLWRQAERVDPEAAARLTNFWGDDSWRKAAYRREKNILGEWEEVKIGNQSIVDAFRDRLQREAGFAYVSHPLPMRNSRNAVVYYLFFASQRPVAKKIVDDIFKKYKDRRG